VTSLRRLLRPEPGRLAVELRSVPATAVAAVRGIVDKSQVLGWYDRAMAELDAALTGRAATGAPGGMYDNELFTLERGGVVVYRPVADPPTTGRVEPVMLPAAELAVTVHRGPHDDIDVSYGRLGAYVSDHALAVDGPVRETYLVGPRDNADPDSWLTEIGWPIFRVAPTGPATEIGGFDH
jgi:hypothetical protein